MSAAIGEQTLKFSVDIISSKIKEIIAEL